MLRKLISPSNSKLVLVVRKDLKMSKGKTAVQCAHAAVLCYEQAQHDPEKAKILSDWCSYGQPKIAVQIDTCDEMKALQKRVQEAGIVAAIVRDAGRTELVPGTITVLGIGPDDVQTINNFVGHLKLL